MSISFIKELPNRGGTVGEDSSRTYIFESDNGLDSEYEVYRNRNCPKIGSQHPNRRFSLFYLKRGDLKITQGTGKLYRYWTVEAEYKQLEADEEPPEEEKDFAQPKEKDEEQFEKPDFNPSLTVEFEDYTAPLEFAASDTPATSSSWDVAQPNGGAGAYGIVNSALEKYNPPPEIFKQNAVIRVTRNLALTSSLWEKALARRNTINTDRFIWRRGKASLTIQPAQSRIKLRIGEQKEYRTKNKKRNAYAQLEVQFSIKKDTWNLDLLDIGSEYLDTAGKTIAQRITDNDWGLAVGTKRLPYDPENGTLGLLDGSGEKLAAGAKSVFNRYPSYEQTQHGGFFKQLTRRK